MHKPKVHIHQIAKKVREKTVTEDLRHRRSVLINIILTIFTCVFIILAVLANQVPYFPIDLSITRTIQGIHEPIFFMLMQLTSLIGYPPQVVVLLLLIPLLLHMLQLTWEALMLLSTGISVVIVNTIVKLIVNRDRPTVDLVRVFTHLNEYSFPSGHVMFYTAFFGFLLFLTVTLLKNRIEKTTLIVVFTFLIIAIGPSRIYLGAHWASDVLGAYLIGTVWLALTIYLYEWGKKGGK